MAVKVFQRSFNGGEVSPSMFARIDDGKYQTGLAKCTNFLIEPQGPITMRPGFAYVNKTKQQDKSPKLIPFTFSTDQTMVLEFGDKYIRFHTQGQTLLDDDGDPYEVVTPYSIDDVFDIHYVQSADVLTLVHPQYAPRELRRYGATDWRLVEINFSSILSAPTNVKVVPHGSGGGTYKREYCVTALLKDGSQESARSTSVILDCQPYGEGAYNDISWDAVEGAGMYRVYRNEGGVWAYVGQTDSLTIRDENIDPDASITPPIYDEAFSQEGGVTSVDVLTQGIGYYGRRGVSGVSNIGWSEFSSDPTHAGTLQAYYFPVPINITDPGSWYGDTSVWYEYRVVDEEGQGTGATAKGYMREIGFHQAEITQISITSPGSNYVKPKIKVTECILNKNNPWTGDDEYYEAVLATVDCYLEPSSDDVKLIIQDDTGGGAVLNPVISDGKIIAVNVVSGGSGYTDPTITVQSTYGSGATFKATVAEAGDYPGAVSYFEQRRWFAGTLQRPNNLWATKSGTESDMSFSLPSQDDDRIAVRVAAREANRIRHIVPLSQLMLLTGSAEWRVSPLNSDAITPSSMSVRPQSYIGANNVQPLVVSSIMLYAQERGGHLRECGYSYEAGGYVSNDICLRAPHLFDNHNVVDMAYSKAPLPIIWSINNDGQLVAMTYVPEQQVGAFSLIETNNGRFRSCCVVSEGDEDILYCVVERIIAGVPHIYIERMTEQKFTTLDRCCFMDSSGTYVGEPTTEVSGLTWLEGMEVSIVADGSVEERQVVKNGKITLSMPSNFVHVGLPYTADAQTLPVAVALQDGSYGSGHQKNVRSMSFRVVNSSGIQAGPDFNDLTEYPARSTESAGSPPNPITDEIDLPISGRWNRSGQVCIRQAYPLPMKIVSVTTTVEIS